MWLYLLYWRGLFYCDFVSNILEEYLSTKTYILELKCMIYLTELKLSRKSPRSPLKLNQLLWLFVQAIINKVLL